MCVIAGYTGSRRAAPILIEMLKKVEYFDGVLTLSIGNTDFPEWLLCELYINGEARYFEIYNGKIKLVV